MSLKKLHLASLLFLAPLASCATTFVDKKPEWQPKKPVPALMVHYSIVDQYSLNKGKSMLAAVTELVSASQGRKQNTVFDKSADKILARIKPVFAHNNMQIYFDKKSTKRVATIEGVIKQSRTNGGKSNNFLTEGDWLHEETVEEPFHMKGTMFQEKYYKQIAEKAIGGKGEKVVVSMGMELNLESSWKLGWVCEASFRARVLNAKGEPVFLVSSSGTSSTYWFGRKKRYLTQA
tara:strand:+ start:424 stop:1125 length:702 start_codon:yes stop_codon:yes gene_type:complete